MLKFTFTHPWLLLVFLFGAGMTLFLYLRLSKKYRRTRNRITSMVLHIIVLALAVLTMAGMMINVSIPNKENQIILLVDVSDTCENSVEQRNEFIETVLRMGQYDGYNIGIVTFGFDQVYAVELTDKIDSIMSKYESAERPDTSATDIASALTYTAGLFTSDTAKIVLVTDGKETDNSASSVIRTIAATGVSVDIANITSSYGDSDMQLVGTVMPDYHITPGTECPVTITLDSRYEGVATVELFDNGVLIEKQTVNVTKGSQNVTFRHTFSGYGMHQLTFSLSSTQDTVEQNNTYQTFVNLDHFNNILILEHKDGESERLKKFLSTEENDYNVTVMNIKTGENVPKTLEELRTYDQVILNNIANADMPVGFDEILYTYVNECGGGLFTVGGADENPAATGENDRYIAHSYRREDMINTLYQELLPVQAINYTPPLAVMVIVDRSGSMGSTDTTTGKTYYDRALAGAYACLDAMSERDYFGLMTLDSNYEIILGMTPRSQEAKIVKAINYARDLGATGSTVFTGAIERASRQLLSVDVARRHIIIVTDGQVPSSQEAEYLSDIEFYHNNYQITYSVVGIGVEEGSTAAKQMQKACEAGGGRLHVFVDATETTTAMREDLNAKSIKEVNYEKFFPAASDTLSSLLSGVDFQTVKSKDENGNEIEKTTNKIASSLDGFFGVKVKSGADLILSGDFGVPIYAQWKFGKGTVGSFMCDLNGTWSSEFFPDTTETDTAGKRFILNVISALLPNEPIRRNEISVNINQKNYTNQLSIFTVLEEGEKVIGEIRSLSDPNSAAVSLDQVTVPEEGVKLSSLPYYVTMALDASSNYSRCRFVAKEPGVYEIRIKKVDSEGNVLAEYTAYSDLHFSDEYLTDLDSTDLSITDNLTQIAKYGNGSLIADLEDPFEVYDGFVTSIEKTFDPRYVFMILAIVLFVTDVAIRKFRFKWPHEIIQSKREKGSGRKGGSDK